MNSYKTSSPTDIGDSLQKACNIELSENENKNIVSELNGRSRTMRICLKLDLLNSSWRYAMENVLQSFLIVTRKNHFSFQFRLLSITDNDIFIFISFH